MEAISEHSMNKKVRISGLCGERSDLPQASCLTKINTVSPIPLENINKNILEWTNLVLPNFGIKFDCNNQPPASDVFTKGIFHFIEEEKCSDIFNFYLKGRETDKEKYECYYHAFLRVLDIDCWHIEDITEDKISELNQRIEECQWIDTFVAEANHKQQLLKRICDRELCKSLKVFMWQLLYMHRKLRGNGHRELGEGMYQELFVSFARIFGLNIVSGSNVEEYSMSVESKEFVAKPDAVICHPSTVDKIFAVIQVMGSSHNEDNEQIRDLRSIQKKCSANHIESSLIGQHGGQFLCSLPYSVFGNRGMYGFIVQGTNVTLTSFKPEDQYYENLCSGCLHKKEAVVTFSKEYNILRKEDRKQLVETFLDFEKLIKFMCIKKSYA